MMESWSYGAEGKGLMFSDEVDLPVDSFSRSRKTWMGWESKSSYNLYKLISDNDATENMEFMDPAFTDLTRKPSCLVASNSFCGEEEFGSKISNSCMESISQDSTLIDLNLGRLVDCRNVQSGKFFKERSVLSSARPSLTAKKARPTSSCSQTPLCQVYGCNKDLSSSKDYHKRHKVCEVHSKTPKVIVKGNEQRFCQQCSRFHLLAEFDDSKRSCRRRLAGHNERRRKPRFNILSDKSRTELAWTSIPKGVSFAFPDRIPGGILFPETYEQANLCNKKQHSLGIPPPATESYNVLNAASTLQEASGFSHSSCALSLLSAQSQILPMHSTGILSAMPLINQVSRTHRNLDQNFDKTSGVRSSQKYASKGFYLSGMNSMDGAHSWSSMAPDAGHAVGLKVETDGFSQESDLYNDRYSCSPERGFTVDLIQLSSHLKRVEQQRNFIQPKLHNDDIS